MLCLGLCACKKEQSKAGEDSSPALSSPEETTSPLEPEVNSFAAELPVHTIPTKAPAPVNPNMMAVEGMNFDLFVPVHIAQSKSWIAHITSSFRLIDACVTAHPDESAFISNVSPQDDGSTIIEMTGHDGYGYDCKISAAGDTPPSLTEKEPYNSPLPLYFPAGVKPMVNNPECYALLRLKSEPAADRGWIADPIEGCVPRYKQE